MNNASYMKNLGKNVMLHHRAFGKAFGFETGKEVVLNAKQVSVYQRVDVLAHEIAPKSRKLKSKC